MTRTERRKDGDVGNVDLVNSISPDRKGEASRGSEVRVKEAGPETLMMEADSVRMGDARMRRWWEP